METTLEVKYFFFFFFSPFPTPWQRVSKSPIKVMTLVITSSAVLLTHTHTHAVPQSRRHFDSAVMKLFMWSAIISFDERDLILFDSPVALQVWHNSIICSESSFLHRSLKTLKTRGRTVSSISPLREIELAWLLTEANYGSSPRTTSTFLSLCFSRSR